VLHLVVEVLEVLFKFSIIYLPIIILLKKEFQVEFQSIIVLVVIANLEPKMDKMVD
jgi:hypothetical protein